MRGKIYSFYLICFVHTTLAYFFTCISLKFNFIRNKVDIQWNMPFTSPKLDISTQLARCREETGHVVKKSKVFSD